MNEANKVVPRAQKEIKISEKDIARFWSKVDKSGGPDACWPWMAGKLKAGYGKFKAYGRTLTSHRVSHSISKGYIPKDGSYHGICVCHKCDVKLCCNPSHLFLGTQADNVKDREDKGRTASGDKSGSRTHPESLARGDANGARKHPERMPRGEAHRNSKLTAEQVVKIRALYATGGVLKVRLAEQFGVSKVLIGFIINRKAWKHI